MFIRFSYNFWGMEVIARCRRENLNPFKPKFVRGDFLRITAEIEDDAPVERIERSARQATPRGYEFIELRFPEKEAERAVN